MKLAQLAAIPLIALAAPAFATGGFSCRTNAPSGVNLDIVTGTGQPGGIVAATLRDGRRRFSTGGSGERIAIGQSWIDERSLLLDLLDREGTARVARLKVGFRGAPRNRTLTGTLAYQGRIARIACAPEQ